MAGLIPIYIRAIQGHSNLDRSIPAPWSMEWEIKPQHTPHVWHSGKSGNLDSIIRCGLLPGGAVKDQRRCQLYFSAKDPRSLSYCAGRPAQHRLRHPITGVALVAWPPSDNDDVIYRVEIRRCNELGIKFRQNPTGAVLSRKSIPPECISEVVNLEGLVLYRNDSLNTIAPGDRKLQMTAGSALKRSTLFLKAEKRMEEWPKPILKTDASIAEELYYKNYDKNFNDEQMCANCHQFSFKGIKFCMKCKKALVNRDNPNEWTELGTKERIDFANANLSELLWKSNVHCRSLYKPYGDKAKKQKGMGIYNRCVKKGVKTTTDGKTKTTRWDSCEHRWRTDVVFNRRMREVNGFGLEDMKLFDSWGTQLKRPIQTMSRQERAKKFKDYRWKLAQKQDGGSDTVPTHLYPQDCRQSAPVEKTRQGITLKESAQWRESQGSSSWKDSSSSWTRTGVWTTSSDVRVKQEQRVEEPQNNPSSSSTAWQQPPWHAPERPAPRGSLSQKPQAEAPWRKEENQQKRRKP